MKRRARSTLAGKKATVCLERNGASIRVDDVPASQAAAVLADMLQAYRALTEHFPELVQDLAPVPGGVPVDVVDEWAEESHRVGFVTSPRVARRTR